MCPLYVCLIRMRGVLVQLASGVFEETFEARVTAAQLAAAAFDGVCVFIITAVPITAVINSRWRLEVLKSIYHHHHHHLGLRPS